MAKGVGLASHSHRYILVVAAVVAAMIACSGTPEEPLKPTSPSPPEAAITFMEGNDCTQSIVAQLGPTWGQVVERGSAPGFVNDEARSVLLDGVPSGTLIRVFDSPDGETSDDWAEIQVTALASGRCVGTFEEDFRDEAITVTYHGVNGLDGKVSRIEILSAASLTAEAPAPPTATLSSTPTEPMAPPQQALEPASATPPVVASVTPERRPDLIVFTPDIIGSPMQDIERMLGAPTEVYDLAIGEVEEVPDGGQERGYQAGGYTIYVTYDKDGIAHGLQVTDGLLEDGYSLDDWPTVLARIGVDFVGLPDIVAPAARRWSNAYGYAIMIAAESIDGTVWTVRIYELAD